MRLFCMPNSNFDSWLLLCFQSYLWKISGWPGSIPGTCSWRQYPEQNQWINDHNCRQGANAEGQPKDGISKKVLEYFQTSSEFFFVSSTLSTFNYFAIKYISVRLRRLLFWWPQFPLAVAAGDQKWLENGWETTLPKRWVDDKGGILFCSWFETLIRKDSSVSSTFLW